MMKLTFHVDSVAEPAAGIPSFYENVEVILQYGIKDYQHRMEFQESVRRMLTEWFETDNVFTEEEWRKRCER